MPRYMGNPSFFYLSILLLNKKYMGTIWILTLISEYVMWRFDINSLISLNHNNSILVHLMNLFIAIYLNLLPIYVWFCVNVVRTIVLVRSKYVSKREWLPLSIFCILQPLSRCITHFNRGKRKEKNFHFFNFGFFVMRSGFLHRLQRST